MSFREFLSSETSDDAPLEMVLPRRKLVVVIGIDDYHHLPKLRCAVQDAVGVQDVLVRDFGFEPLLPPLTNQAATKSAIEALIDDQLYTLLQPDDALILFFAGHGTTRLARLNEMTIETGYIAPVEARGIDHISDFLNMEELLRRIGILRARHILVVLDACHSGMALGSAMRQSRAGLETFVQQLTGKQSRGVITSARRDELALDNGPIPGHSLFTGTLIDALTNGRADLDNNGVITFAELGLYLQQRVGQASISRQTPDFGTFDYDDRGQFVLALRGGSGGHTVQWGSAQPQWLPTPLPRPRRRRYGFGLFLGGITVIVVGIAVTIITSRFRNEGTSTLGGVAGAASTNDIPAMNVQGWVPIVSATGGFKAQMPGKPLTTSNTVSSQDDLVGFNIRWTDRTAADTRLPATVLDDTRDNRIKNGCKNVSENWIAHGKYPAREWVFDCGNGPTWNERVILAGSRLYTLVVTGYSKKDISATAQSFFASFEITR